LQSLCNNRKWKVFSEYFLICFLWWLLPGYVWQVNIGLLIGAHSSTSSDSLCDGINTNGLHHSMANVWALHMYNQRQRLNSFDEIGVFIYDTCADPGVAQRQTVRLVSHLFSVGNRVCRDSKTYPPLIGNVLDFWMTFRNFYLKYQIPFLFNFILYKFNWKYLILYYNLFLT